MSISRRLKQAEKLAAGNGAHEAAEADLMEWLKGNRYKEGQGENFHEWSDRMPKKLVKTFADYVRKHIGMRSLDLANDWIGA